MEVDLLCERGRLVIELDGGQHLGDAEDYRRDRRKDVALQERVYFVLRFLAGDVGSGWTTCWMRFSGRWSTSIVPNPLQQ